jgi:hypothetical protein
MIRDANGDWGTVVYDATDPRRATFSRAASQSSVFNPVTGEFDGSSSVSGDSEVTVTGHETNEAPAEKNRFERNLETIFVDANISLTPPDDEEDASSDDDTVYAVNTDPPGSVWGAAASGFVSGFFSRKTFSSGLGAAPVVGTVLSVGELGFGYDYVCDEDVDRRVAGVGLVAGLLPAGKPIGKLVAKNFDKLAGPLAKLFSKAPNSGLGSSFNTAGRLARNTDLPVVAQCANNTCGPHSVGMVLDMLRGGRSGTSLVKLNLTASGTKINRLDALLRRNGIPAQWKHSFGIDDVAKATSGRNPLIAHVKSGSGGHFVVVDGVTTRLGQLVVAIRDPAGGRAYFETVEAFMKRFSGQVVELQ